MEDNVTHVRCCKFFVRQCLSNGHILTQFVSHFQPTRQQQSKHSTPRGTQTPRNAQTSVSVFAVMLFCRKPLLSIWSIPPPPLNPPLNPPPSPVDPPSPVGPPSPPLKLNPPLKLKPPPPPPLKPPPSARSPQPFCVGPLPLLRPLLRLSRKGCGAEITSGRVHCEQTPVGSARCDWNGLRQPGQGGRIDDYFSSARVLSRLRFRDSTAWERR